MDQLSSPTQSVLIVDDNPRLVEDYKSFLEEAGFTCYTAEDGEAGLAQARAHHPAVIILDLMLPKIDGISVLKDLKEDPELKDTPVIVLTALSEEVEKKASLESGAVEFLEKVDIDPQHLLHKVKKLMPEDEDAAQK